MYLIPRLIGVSSYIVTLLLFAYLISHASSKNAIKLTWIYYFVLLLMAAFFVPDQSADLSRYINNMHFYVSSSNETFERALLKTSTPGGILLLYVIGQFNNDRLLPLFAAGLDFFFIFSILRIEIKKFNSYGNQLSIALLVLMSSGFFMWVISGIRNMMAYSIIIYCIYKEFFLEKKLIYNLPLYIIACSIHSMGQVVFLYRIIFSMFESNNKKHRILNLMIAVSILLIICYHGTRFIDDLFDRGERYYISGRDGTGYFYIWNLIISLFNLIIALFFIFEYYIIDKKIRKINLHSRFSEDKYLLFSIPIIIIAPILMFIQYSFFTRTCAFINLLNYILAIIVINKSRLSNSEIGIVNKVIILSIVLLLISCARGDICSLKFFI